MRDNRRTTESQRKTYEELITETETHWERILEMLGDTEVGENRERGGEIETCSKRRKIMECNQRKKKEDRNRLKK